MMYLLFPAAEAIPTPQEQLMPSPMLSFSSSSDDEHSTGNSPPSNNAFDELFVDWDGLQK